VNLDDFVTKELADNLTPSNTCTLRNSEGKYQAHDWSDRFLRWGFAYGLPVRQTYRECVRCGHEQRLARGR
jgi:hypothetical protein